MPDSDLSRIRGSFCSERKNTVSDLVLFHFRQPSYKARLIPAPLGKGLGYGTQNLKHFPIDEFSIRTR